VSARCANMSRMVIFGRSDDLDGAEFVDVSLRGARFVNTDLSNAVLRGVDVQDVEIDGPWLFQPGGRLRVNGVDVMPFVEAELNDRYPARAERRAGDPAGLRSAWAGVERTWATTLTRAAAMPVGTVDRSVDGEWSFAQTLRHLVMATDLWLGRAVLGRSQPFHALGLSYSQNGDTKAFVGVDMTLFVTGTPPYDDVLEARADRVATVRDFLATVTPEELTAAHRNPHNPDAPVTTLSCLQVILAEEWEHHRFAVRDLDAIQVGDEAGPRPSSDAES
jgi:hypothetical protein